MSSKVRPDVIVNGKVAESRNDVALETPTFDGDPFCLHQHPDVLSDSVGKHEPPRLLPRLAQLQRSLDRLHLPLFHRREERVLGDAEGEEELRLAIEEKRGGAELLAGANEIVEVDVRRQIL